ncbi:MAG: hypothetical protein WDZ90_02610 [Candidatus Paceibacterota bacterium]
MRYTQEQVEQAYNNVPAQVQELMGSVEESKKMQEIAKEFSLHVDQQDRLFDEITYVRLGLEPSDSFETNLKKYVDVNTEVAQSLAKQVNEKIFLPMREKLKINGKREEEENEASSASKIERSQTEEVLETPAQESGVGEVPENLPREQSEVKKEESESIPQSEPQTLAREEGHQPIGLTEESSTELKAKEETPSEAQPRAPRDRSTYKADPYREPIE